MKLPSSRNKFALPLAELTEPLLFYAFVILPVVCVVVVFAWTYVLVGRATSALSWFDFLKSILKYSWLTGFLFVGSNIAGMIRYGSPKKAIAHNAMVFGAERWNASKKLVVTYVSRGENAGALARAVAQTRAILENNRVNYEIELVTDLDVSTIGTEPHTFFIQVPSDFETLHRTKYKARALQYALLERAKRGLDPRNTWLMHLDEESVLTESALSGMHMFMNDPAKQDRVGQGEIKYNAYGYCAKPLITAIDAVRTGDDLGRFRLQYKKFHRPVFGMHGSFILVPYHIEHAIGFDLGGRGSITEDAYFALKAYEEGYQFDWVDGYIKEQSPFSLLAIIKQRRRWFSGLLSLSFDRAVPFTIRKYLMLNMFLWGLAWLGPIITLLDLATGGGYFPLFWNVMATVILGGVISVYAIGTYRNLQDMNFSWIKKAWIMYITILLVPVSSFIEGIAILYALISPVRTFDVVNKN